MQLHKSFPLACTTYSKVFNVEIRMQGAKAFTDGKKIIIPRLNLKNKVEQNKAFAYLAHEAGHIRYTDFKFLKDNKITNQFIFSLFNLFEDCRIERLMGLEFIGVWENLEQLRLSLTTSVEDLVTYLNNTNSILDKIMFYITLTCFYKGNQYEGFKPYLDKVISHIKEQKYLSESEFLELDDIIIGASRAKDSKTTFIYVLCLIDFLDKYKLIPNNKEDNRIKNIVKIAINDIDDCIDNIEKNTFDKLVRNIGKKLNDISSFKDNKEVEEKDSFLTKTLNSFIPSKYICLTLGDAIDDMYEGGTTSRDDYGVVLHDSCKKGRADFLYEVIKNHGTLRGKIRRFVLSFKEAFLHESKFGKKINVKRAQFLTLGEQRIFFKEQDIVDYNTCIHLLVDCSGSMDTYDNHSYKRIDAACQCALATALALDGVDFLECAVSYFPGYKAEVSIAKHYSEKAYKKAAFFDQDPKGSTPLAQAIWHAIDMMSKNERKRGIIIVITDGFPDSKTKTREVIDFCKKNNIEVYGIGINNNAIENIVDKFTIIENLNDLDITIYKLFKEIIDKSFYVKTIKKIIKANIN